MPVLVIGQCFRKEKSRASANRSLMGGNDWRCLLLFWSVGGLPVLSVASLEGL